MKLKELVQKVQQTVDEYKSIGNNMMPSNMPQMHFTLEQQENLYAPFAAEIDIGEIINLNRTFWDAGITLDVYHEVLRAIAIGLYMQCKSKDERHELLNRLDAQGSEIKAVNDRWNRVPKGKYIDSRLGTFDKVEFIQKFGVMYNSTDEANADANDKSGICPLLMGILNSGWNDIMATVENGKVVVKKHNHGLYASATSYHIEVMVDFKSYCRIKHAAIENKAFRLAAIYDKMRRKPLRDVPHGGETIENPELFVEALESFMLDENWFPQTVHDFRTRNTTFIAIIKGAFMFMKKFNEMHIDLLKALVNRLLDYMDAMAKLECQLIAEQQMQDPETGAFIHPKFDTSYLVYTRALANVIDTLEMRYYKVMRRNRIEELRESSFAYFDYCWHIKNNSLDELLQKWEQRHYWGYEDGAMQRQVAKLAKRYEMDSKSPFFDIGDRIDKNIHAQYDVA